MLQAKGNFFGLLVLVFTTGFGMLSLNANAAMKSPQTVEFESAVYPPSSFRVKKAQKLGYVLETKHGLRLTGELSIPLGNGPFPAVVLMHGCNGIARWNKVWAKWLVGWGYVVLGVDSFNPRGEKNICTQPLTIPDFTRSLDAHGAKEYLAALKVVDRSRIAVMGMSHGGWSALHAIKPSTPANLKQAPFRAAVTLYPYCETPEQSDQPILILIGEKDEATPVERCKRYVSALEPPHKTILKVFPGAHHAFDLEGVDKQIKIWIDEHVKYRTVRYDPQAAEQAIQMVDEFLKKWLKY